MARHLKIAAAQLGPLHKSDSRAAAVSRLKRLLQDAHAMGAKFVVFPELAFTTFFPRWWMDDQREVDAKYFEKSMPSKDTQPLFDEAKKLGIGFYIGYAELTPEGRRFNTAILVGPDGSIVGKYRKIHLPGHAEHKPQGRVPASGEEILRGRRSRLPRLEIPRRDHRHADLQRPALARGVPRARAAGRRDRRARLQHAEREPALPRAAGAARAPPPDHGAVDGVPERHLAGRDRESRVRGRLPHVRPLA